MQMYQTEEEQVEAIKAWWDQNGKQLLIGLGLFLAAIFGYRSWMDHQVTLSESASIRYEKMLLMQESDIDGALAQGQSILNDFSGSHYATLARLAMAKIAVTKADLNLAAEHLAAVVSSEKESSFGQLARLRLARVQLANSEADKAMQTLEQAPFATPYLGAYQEIRGDVLLAQGDRKAAALSYSSAQALYSDQPQKRDIVTLKLDDLAGE